MVPAGMPGAPEGDFMPAYDPAGARALLAEAGYRDGQRPSARSRSSPTAPATTSGIVTMLEENLGVTIDYATMDFATYQARLATDPPRMWSISWVADYPGPNDFLGVLLGTGSTANQGGWSIARVRRGDHGRHVRRGPAAATAAYARAMGIVRDQAPVVPVSYGTSFSLVRDGLLGASQNGLGILRLAGLEWADGR